MKQESKKSGRPPKVDAITFRCSVNFNAAEEAALLTMHEQSGVASLSAFIKMHLFGKTFKVYHIDDITRIFIYKLSALNAQYRTIGVEYDSVVKLLRQHFTEKKAMQALYKLEQAIISLVKVNRQIVSLANEFDAYWREKTGSKDEWSNVFI